MSCTAHDCEAIRTCLSALPSFCVVKTLVLSALAVHRGAPTVQIAVDGNTSVALQGMGAAVDGGCTAWLFSVTGGASLSLSNLTLQNALGSGGGAALHVQSAGAVRVDGVRFFQNEAGDAGKGGAVSIVPPPLPLFPGRADFADCQWESNRARACGGGVHSQSCSPTFLRCMWLNNSAWGLQGYGGGLDLNQSSAAPGALAPTFTASTFDGNTAHSNGGGANVENASPVFDGCTWVRNAAGSSGTGSGGGLNLKYTASGQPRFSRCVFLSNRAGQEKGSNGGGASFMNASPSFDNCQWQNNSVGVCANDRPKPIGQGGGLNLKGQGVAPPVFRGCVFGNNAGKPQASVVRQPCAPALLPVVNSHIPSPAPPPTA